MAINDAGMFTVKEINRLKILQDVIDRNIRPGQAAEMLGITPRHCSRLLKRYRQVWFLFLYLLIPVLPLLFLIRAFVLA